MCAWSLNGSPQNRVRLQALSDPVFALGFAPTRDEESIQSAVFWQHAGMRAKPTLLCRSETSGQFVR